MPHTPGPYRSPYIDTRPNGLRAIRVDSSETEGVDVVALLPVGDGSAKEIVGSQQANARLLLAAPKLLHDALTRGSRPALTKFPNEFTP